MAVRARLVISAMASDEAVSFEATSQAVEVVFSHALFPFSRALCHSNFRHTMSCERLLSEIVESRAAAQPHAVFAKVPRDNAYTNGYRIVTNAALMRAVDHVVALITSAFGPGKDFPRIAYLGLNDLRYTIVLLAGIKTGYTMYFPSPRNSEEAHAALLASLECSRMIKTCPGPVGVSTVESITTEVLTIPTLGELLDLNPEQVRAVAYGRSFGDARADPIFILHTSGSTGTPKPLIYTNEYVARIYNTQALVPPAGFESVNEQLKSGSCLVTLPPFHIAGLAFTLIFPALYGSVPVYPTAGTPPGLEVFLGALAATSVDWAFVSPVVVDEIGKDPVALKSVAGKLEYLFYTGGSVPKESGKAVARAMSLNQVLGSSECAAFPLLRSKGGDRTEDWNHVQVHPEANVQYIHQYGDCYEMVQVRGRERYQPVFCHFNTLDAYPTKDLFTKHPSSPDTYKHVGRLDDIIVFLNGEKANPVSFQDRVNEHPEVRAALVVGHGRQEASLLLEPARRESLSEDAKRRLVEKIWPTVEKCNSLCPRHARVSKSKVLIAPSQMPFIRAGKGTVQRQSTLVLFESMIDRLYREDEEVDSISNADVGTKPLSIEDVVERVKRLVHSTYAVSSETSNFFSEGMDSQQAIHLWRGLRQEFPGVSTNMKTIYSNATIQSLATAIVQSGHGECARDCDNDDAQHLLRRYLSKIDALLDAQAVHYNGVNGAADEGSAKDDGPMHPIVDQTFHNKPEDPVQGAILLTGSTGALGSHLLNTLLERGRAKVYCLNRSEDSRDLQSIRNKRRGLPIIFPEDRVRFLTGDPALPKFGVGDEVFEELQRSVTHVVHNAWPVDFNKSLRSFAGCLDGVVGLVSFALHSQTRVALQFVSSIAAIAGSPQRAVVVAEQAATEAQAPVSMGYGQSKYLAERMLAHASRVLGTRTIVVRVGQISGDGRRKRGWNRREWFPSLVVSSLHIHALPNSLGCAAGGKEVNWIPVDSVAKILQELSVASPVGGANQTFHVVHPRSVAWKELLPTFQGVLDGIASERGVAPVEVVDYRAWFDKLEASSVTDSTNSGDLSTNPAVKLLPFFESLLSEEDLTAAFDVSRATSSSSTMRSLELVDSSCLRAWVRGWIQGDEI